EAPRLAALCELFAAPPVDPIPPLISSVRCASMSAENGRNDLIPVHASSESCGGTALPLVIVCMSVSFSNSPHMTLPSAETYTPVPDRRLCAHLPEKRAPVQNSMVPTPQRCPPANSPV